MTKVRLLLLGSLAGCMVLAAGCRSLAGSACLKAPPEADTKNAAPLRIPVGLDSLDASSALKVPSSEEAVVVLPAKGCLEDPPMLQKLPDPKYTEKEQKKLLKATQKAEKKAAREAAKEAKKQPDSK